MWLVQDFIDNRWKGTDSNPDPSGAQAQFLTMAYPLFPIFPSTEDELFNDRLWVHGDSLQRQDDRLCRASLGAAYI